MQTATTKTMIQAGEFYYLEQGGNFLKVKTEQAQTSSRAKKIWVVSGNERIWAFIHALITPEDYTTMIEGAVELAAMEAEDKTAAAVPEEAAPKLFKKNQEYYWLSPEGDFRRGIVQRDQEAATPEKVLITDWKFGQRWGTDPHWVNVNTLYTSAQYEAKLEADKAAAAAPPEEAAPLYKAGEWVSYTEWPGDVRAAECCTDQVQYCSLVCVINWHDNQRRQFTIEDKKLTRITCPDKVAAAIANKEAVEAKREEMRAAERARDKAERDAAIGGITSASVDSGVTVDTEKAIKSYKAHSFVMDEPIYWRKGLEAFLGRVEETQRSPNSKKIKISLLDPKTKTHYLDPFFAFKSDLMLPAEFKVWSMLNAGKKSQDTAPIAEADQTEEAAADVVLKQGDRRSINRVKALSSGADEETPAPEAKALFNGPESFAELIAKAENFDQIGALCDRLLALPMFARLSDTTKMQKLAPYNKAIKTLQIPLVEGTNAVLSTKQDGSQELRHYYFKKTGILDHPWHESRKVADQKVLAKLDNQAIELDADQYCETIKFCLVNDDPFVQLAGLIADSGRRIIEVLHQGEFTEVEADPQMVVFSGQAKKQDNEVKPFSITLLVCTAREFIAKIQQVRSHEKVTAAYKGLSDDDNNFLKKLSDRVRVNINRVAVGKHFSWLPKRTGEINPTCKTLRAMTAAIIADRYCPPTTNKLLYTSRLLGHSVQDAGDIRSLQVTLGYSDIVIKTAADKSGASPAQVPDSVAAKNSTIEAQLIEAGDAIADALEDLAPEELQQFAAAAEAADLPESAQLAIASYIDLVEDMEGDRHEFDFYETPDWLPLAVLENIEISGTIGECCNGYGAMSDIFKMAGFEVWTNDIDPAKVADLHGDATAPEFWESAPAADWIITNPPYKNLSAQIVKNAFEFATKGIVMILKMNWWELCEDRAEFLKIHPPTGFINVPRYCYRKGTATGKWATDEAPTVAYIWDKSQTHGLTKMIPLPASDLRLFYRNPDQRPARELVKEQVDQIMAKLAQVKAEKLAELKAEKPPTDSQLNSETVTEGNSLEIKGFPIANSTPAIPKAIARITSEIGDFLKFNQKLDPVNRWYVGQTIIKAITGCNNRAANAWIQFYKDFLAVHNEGLSPVSQNRGRVFSW